MEARKLQKTGGSTFTLSLPKGWVIASRLKAGDTVFVDEIPDGTLAIRPKPAGQAGPRTKAIEANELRSRDHLLRTLIGGYIAGYDVLEVRFKPEDGPSVRRVVREFTRMVLGPEILEEGRTSIVVQDLSHAAELSAEKTLRRMHLTVRAMHEDALAAVRTRDPELTKDVEQRDEDVDRLYWLVEKQYSLAHLGGPTAEADWRRTGIHDYRLVAKLLERVGDHAERIAVAARSLKADLEPKLVRDLQAASRASLDVLETAFTALMAGDVRKANEAVDRAQDLEKTLDALTHRVAAHKGEELLALGEVMDSIRRTGGYSADIAEIAINHVLAKEG